MNSLTRTDSRMVEYQAQSDVPARPIHTVFTDRGVSLKDFGAFGDDNADDTDAIEAAANKALELGVALLVTPGTYLISRPILLTGTGLRIVGSSMKRSIFKAAGNFEAMFSFDGAAAVMAFEHIGFNTVGTSTKCVDLLRATAISFAFCVFEGDRNGALVYSTGDLLAFDACTFHPSGANTWAIYFDEHNQNCRIQGGLVGMPGNGFRVLKSGSGPRVEGLSISNVKFINTGGYNIYLEDCYLTTIENCICDQANTYNIYLGARCQHAIIDGNWIGTGPATEAVCVRIAADSSGLHVIDGNVMSGGNACISVQATPVGHCNGLTISNNTFTNAHVVTVGLDSVERCRIVGNVDFSTPSQGSWNTLGTAGPGQYTFIGNNWHSTAPVHYHDASDYRFDADTGIVGASKGVFVMTSPATTVAIPHSVFRAPRVVTYTIQGSGASHQLSAIDASTFTVTLGAPSQVTVHWRADV